jgi:hypothetical protein
MANFDAGLDELTYNFTKVGGKQGVIPEPSTLQVETFTEMLQQVMPLTQDAEGKTILDVKALVAKSEAGEDLGYLINHAIADLTSGEITAEEIAALPFRTQRAFYGWIVGTFLSPEA